MSGSRRFPAGEEPPGSLVLQLSRRAGLQERRRLSTWLETMLPHCNWRTQVLLLDDPPAPEPAAAGAVIGTIIRHLEEHPLTGVALRPVLSLQPGEPCSREQWQPLLATARPFQREGYEQQTESRFAVMPIIFTPAAALDAALEQICWLHDSLAVPTLLISGEPAPEQLEELHRRDIEVLVVPAHPQKIVDTRSIVCWLRAMAVLEGLRERLDLSWGDHRSRGESSVDSGVDSGKTRCDTTCDTVGKPALLEPCPRHVVLHQEQATLAPCLAAGERRMQAVESMDGPAPLPDGFYAGLSASCCVECLADSALAMSDLVTVGKGQAEMGRICFTLGQLAAERRQHRLAGRLAHRAFELATTDHDRGAALVEQGLSHLACGEPPRAEHALAAAAQCSDDPGLVAFHRGRVQLAWRDEIEALERFEEALGLGSPSVSLPQLHFTMALCHINLEEYADARPHLERAIGPSELTAPVLFYQGVCDLNEGAVETAQASFEAALRIPPAPEDLGRVLFYLATCHKEQGRLDPAIELLQQAIAADPEDLANHNLIGYCYYALGRHEEAVSSFLSAVTIDPGSAIDWANLGSNLRELGKTEEAVLMYRKALSLDPTIGFAVAALKRLTSA